MSTPEERLKTWRQEQEAKTAEGRRRIWARERQPPTPAPAPQPAQQPEGAFSSFQTGVAGPLLRNVVETAADFYNAPGETLERVGRGALEFVSAFDPAGNAYEPTVRDQAARVAELNRRADERLPEFVKSAKIGMELEEAKPRTRAGRIAGAVGSVLGEVAFPTAPEAIAGNVITAPFGASAARSAGKVVAPILQRIRGRNVGAAVAEAPVSTGQIRATGAVAEREAGQQAAMRAPTTAAAYETPSSLPVRESIDAPPLLEVADEAPFGVTLGKERARTPGKVGPKFDEAVELELKKKADPTLGTKAERTPVLETISAFIKAGMLTGPRTHLKNVGGTGAFQISEELARIPGSIVDAVASFRTGRRTLTGPDAAGLARSFQKAATEGIDEAKKAIRTGQTKFDAEGLQEINSKWPLVNKYVNGVFRVLKAEDVVFRTYATRRALEERARALALTEARQGKIARGQIGERTRELVDNPPTDLQFNAMADGEFAVFANDNFLSQKIVNPIRQSLQNSKDYPKLAKTTEFVIDRVFPFIKTPTNVIARMLEYSGITSGPKAIYLAGKLLKNTMTAAEQRAFAQSFGRASIGVGLVTLGWKLYRAGKATGFVEDDPGRRARDTAAGRTPGSLKIGNQWLQITGAAPLGSLIALGATLARETEQEAEGTGALPVLETIGQAVGEQPLLIGSKQIGEAITKPGSVGEKFLGGVLGTAIPTAVSDVAEAFDPQAREATGITGRLQSRIPGVRNTLPPAQDVLGQPRQDFGPGQAFLDPTRATTDVASQNQLFAELVRLDVGLSGFEKKKDEADEAFRTRSQELGSVYLPAGQQLVSSREYAQASDEVKREAVKILNRRAKFVVEEDRQPGGSLLPSSVIAAAVSSIRKENMKKNAARK